MCLKSIAGVPYKRLFVYPVKGLGSLSIRSFSVPSRAIWSTDPTILARWQNNRLFLILYQTKRHHRVVTESIQNVAQPMDLHHDSLMPLHSSTWVPTSLYPCSLSHLHLSSHPLAQSYSLRSWNLFSSSLWEALTVFFCIARPSVFSG